MCALAVAATVTVNVTLCPTIEGLPEDVRVVVLGYGWNS
jgi:hypothetical protein